MLRLTLRTLLAYLDDTLDPATARDLGARVAASEPARELMDRIKRVTRRRGLQTPAVSDRGDPASDANTVAQYLSNTLPADQVAAFEQACLDDDIHLAEAAACHQILTVVLTEPVRVPPRANQRMYKLVEPPAALPDRKPGKAIPVGGMPAAAVESAAEADEADAALLLGMRRYSAGPRSGRLRLAAAVLGLAALLVGAVVMALPRTAPTPPPAQPGPVSYAGNPPAARPVPPAPVETYRGEIAPPPRRVTGAKPKPEGPKAVEKKPTPAVKPPEPPLANKVPAPVNGGERVGYLFSENVLVLTRKPDPAAGWLRLARGERKEEKKFLPPDTPGSVVPGQTVLCLPGYKAEIRTDTDLAVRLWGNIPEVLPPDVLENHVPLEVRVRFHTPPDGFDADLTLLTGRVYLKTRKEGGARVRVRAAGEVFDITLPGPTADVMAELVYFYPPGSTYVRGKADAPRADLKVAVVAGVASVAAPERAAAFDKLTAPTVIARDPKTEQLRAPAEIPPDKWHRYEFNTLLEAKVGVEVQRALTTVAARVDTPDGITGALAERLTDRPEKPADSLLPVILNRAAAYAQQAVLAEGPTGTGLKNLLDRLDEVLRGYIRPAATFALAAWLTQDAGNCDKLRDLLAAEYGDDADRMVQLLRGAVTVPPPGGKLNGDDLDRLVGLLNHKSVAVRQLALANLLFADRLFGDPTGGPDADVAMPDEQRAKFVAAWRARVREIKDRQVGVPAKKPEEPKKPPAEEGKKPADKKAEEAGKK
jgi:hypothetical protein